MIRPTLGIMIVALAALRLAGTNRALRKLRGDRPWDDPTSMNPLFRERGFQQRLNAVYARIIRDIALLLSLWLMAELLL